jgi:hypothetical protein
LSDGWRGQEEKLQEAGGRSRKKGADGRSRRQVKIRNLGFEIPDFNAESLHLPPAPAVCLLLLLLLLS